MKYILKISSLSTKEFIILGRDNLLSRQRNGFRLKFKEIQTNNLRRRLRQLSTILIILIK